MDPGDPAMPRFHYIKSVFRLVSHIFISASWGLDVLETISYTYSVAYGFRYINDLTLNNSIKSNTPLFTEL
jgi:hypothetical protein